MTSACLFCRIVSGEIPAQKIFETEEVLAFLDIQPIQPGHVLVVPKEHAATFLDMSEQSVASCMIAAQRVARALMRVTNADGFNLKQNNGEAAGQAVHHVHVHLIPRFSNDGLASWSGRALDSEKMAEWAERFREVLKNK